MMRIKKGDVYTTKAFGELIVLEYRSSLYVMVLFPATGYVTVSQAAHIRSGRVKDKLKPVIYGEGYIGDGLFLSGKSGKNNVVYDVWRNMLKRCYCYDFLDSNKTYKGATVCDQWKNFQIFAEWYYKNLPDQYEKYDLDKDIKGDGRKVYSPKTCTLTSRQKNVEKALSKEYNLISPEGKAVLVYNLSKFCRDNKIGRSGMSEMVRGKNKTCKGWSLHNEKT